MLALGNTLSLFSKYIYHRIRWKNIQNYLNSMEIEQPNTNGVFQSISPLQIANIPEESFLYSLECLSPAFIERSVRILLTDSKFYLIDDGTGTFAKNECYCVVLDFDLKFQIIYAEKENPASKKLGIKLFLSYEKQNDFFFNNSYEVNSLTQILSSRLNQRGFHYHFKPIKKLGKGNFATVYEVARIPDGSRFAVKAFSKINTFSSPNGKQGLINELEVLRHLSHENIMSLESVFESDNSIYVVLELLDKKSLYDVIKEKKGNFTFGEVQKIMFGLLRGLKEMGRKRIIHRDLKPENIMIKHSGKYNFGSSSEDTDYHPVIIDFGLSTPCDIPKYLYYRCGTPGFVAPEVIKAHQNMKTQPACDVFSVGCIFHILLTGYPIFPGTQYSEVYQKNKHLQFNFRMQKIHEKSSQAFNLLQQMLIQDPSHRISPQKALAHSFFGDCRQDSDLQTLEIESRSSQGDKKQ